MGLDNSVSMCASQERRLLMFLSSCCTATRVSLSFFTLQTQLIQLQTAGGEREEPLLPVIIESVLSPGSNQVQEVLPAVADLAEFLLDFSRLALVTGSGQPLSQLVQLQLVLLSHRDLLLVVLWHNTARAQGLNAAL